MTKTILRQFIATLLAVLLVPFFQMDMYAQPPGGYAPLDAPQLNQLVAPIALYPDSLVAQILTASTYPQQVAEAENWMQQNGGMPPDQRAAAVNSMPWDPSVKALTEFPSVLDNVARNYSWTAQLGNAYYNQPGDVMNAVQAMRMQAQEAGTLRSTPQQRVYDNGGLIAIQPVNPAFVYVPYYNPWAVYGAPIPMYSGWVMGPAPRGIVLGMGIGFAAGISLGLYSHYGWGYHAWAPNWRGGVVVYNHANYFSHSTSVYNHGHFGGYNRGVYEHGGRGVPGNFHAAYAHGGAVGHAGAPSAYRGASGYHAGAPGGAARAPMGRPGQYASRPGTFNGAHAGGAAGHAAASPGGRQFGQAGHAASPSGHQFGQAAHAGGGAPHAGGSPMGGGAHAAPHAGGGAPHAAGGHAPAPHGRR